MPSNRKEREQAVRHSVRTIDCAARLGAKAVVLHLGRVEMRHYTNSLLDLFGEGKTQSSKFLRLRDQALHSRARHQAKYLDEVFRALDIIVPRAKEMKVKLGMETRFCIDEIPDEAEANAIMARFGSDTIGYWHDVGHAQVRENLGLATQESLLEQFRGRTFGMHLQDFAPPAFDHMPPGLGEFEFSRLAPFVTPDLVLTWEIHPEWKTEQIVESVKRVHDVLRSPSKV
jgi:sugar phosphate isomerase/epimerase